VNRTRSLWAVLLLVTFVGGGVLSPVLHRAHHAVEQSATGDVCHPASVHDAQTPLWTSDAAFDTSSCDLCATRVLVDGHALTRAPAPGVTIVERVAFESTPVPAPVAVRLSIRGPPLRA